MYSRSATTIAALLAEQCGVISFRQVVTAGCDRELPAREVAAQRWQQPHRGIYVEGVDVLTLVQRASCARLVAGKDAVISGPLACQLLGVPDSPALTAVAIVPDSCRRRGSGDFLVRRSARTPTTTDLGGVPVADAPRAVVDACRLTSDLRSVRAVVCGAINAKHASYDELLHEHSAEPRAGLGLMSRALLDWADGARSAPEAEVADELRRLAWRGELPPFLLNPNVYEGAVLIGALDVYVPGRALGGETDSVRHHGAPDALDATLQRHTTVERLGIRLEHVTPARFRQSPRTWAAWFAAVAQERQGLGDPAGLRIEPVGPLQPVPGRRRPR